MQERLKSDGVKGVLASTMHSLSVRILMRKGEDFSIYDQDDCNSIIKRLAKKHKITDKDEFYEIGDEIALLKDNQITAVQCSSKYRAIYLDYEKELYDNRALDFADLITRLVGESITGNIPWDHILVDEVQDLSNGQIVVVRNMYERLSRREGTTVTLVGDIDQSVYEWRNAKPIAIKNFVEKNAEIIPLGTNFRSTRNIVDFSRKLISNNRNRVDKPLVANSKEYGPTPKIQWFYDSLEEADYIANLCSKSKDICVLYRSNWMSMQLEVALKARNISYTVSDTIRFIDRKEVKDVLAYIRVACNSQDKQSLTRAIQTPKRGFGKKAIEKITRFEDIIDEPKLSDFVSRVFELREKAEDAGIGIQLLLLRTNYLGNDERDKKANLDQLVTILKGKTLQEAMFDLTGGTPTEDGDNTNRVHLMTLHSSKGTEYEKVIIMGCEEGITPHINSDNQEEERRLFYVGMTRPEQELIFTYTGKRLMFGSYVYQKPTRYFKELGLKI